MIMNRHTPIPYPAQDLKCERNTKDANITHHEDSSVPADDHPKRTIGVLLKEKKNVSLIGLRC